MPPTVASRPGVVVEGVAGGDLGARVLRGPCMAGCRPAALSGAWSGSFDARFDFALGRRNRRYAWADGGIAWTVSVRAQRRSASVHAHRGGRTLVRQRLGRGGIAVVASG